MFSEITQKILELQEIVSMLPSKNSEASILLEWMNSDLNRIKCNLNDLETVNSMYHSNQDTSII